jgi:arginine decarboxylase-like protein
MAMNLFSGGYLPLDQRCLAENLYWAILVKLKKLVAQMDDVPEDLLGLDDAMADTYFCNFSLFQSCPDSWAIKQLFPVMPIHRLNTPPTTHAVLGDITCDSDGKIDTFIDRRDVKRTLPLHKRQRRAVLPRRVPHGGLPGDPGRSPQPLRRHARRARQPRRGRQRRARRRHQG